MEISTLSGVNDNPVINLDFESRSLMDIVELH